MTDNKTNNYSNRCRGETNRSKSFPAHHGI